jgi:hypothetical protein
MGMRLEAILYLYCISSKKIQHKILIIVFELHTISGGKYSFYALLRLTIFAINWKLEVPNLEEMQLILMCTVTLKC